MNVNSCQKGRFAETIALDFLVEKGFLLLDRNWRCGHKELDLIMRSCDCATGEQILHIVEVRSLTEPLAQMPFESVDYKKRKSIIVAANRYVKMKNIDYETQFDIISIVFKSQGEYNLDYFPNAFAPEW